MGEMLPWAEGERVTVVHRLTDLDVQAQIETESEVVAVDEDLRMVAVKIPGLRGDAEDGLWFPFRAFNLDSHPPVVGLEDAELAYAEESD